MPTKPRRRSTLPKWLRAISPAQRRHLAETLPSFTLRGFRATRAHQHQTGLHCFDCDAIANRLHEKGIL